MRRLIEIIVALMTILFLLPVHLSAVSKNNHLRVVKSDSSGLIIDLKVPKPRVEEVPEDGILYHKISIPGFLPTTDVGSPLMLKAGGLVRVPSGSSPSIEILESKSAALPGYNILPAPRPVIIEEGMSRHIGFEFALDKEKYNFNGFIPPDIAQIDYEGFMREEKVIRVVVFPFQFNPVTGELRYYSRITLKIYYNVPEIKEKSISKEEKIRGQRLKKEDSSYEKLLKGVLLNYD